MSECMENILKEQKKDKYYRLIELLAFWEGGVNATDIANHYSFTNKQGKQYLSQYKQRCPHNLTYDPSLKKFLPTSSFQCNYIQQSVGEYLEWLNHVSIQNMPVNNHFIDNTFHQIIILLKKQSPCTI